MKIIAFSVLLVLCCTQAIAQDIDSLKAVLKDTPQDTTRVNLLIQLSSVLWKTEPDAAIKYAEQASTLAAEAGFEQGQAYALKNIGLAYYIKGDYVNVLANWNSSLDIFRSISDKTGVGNMLSNIGAVYFNQGDAPKAIEYYLDALKVSEEIGDTLRMATVMSNLGAAYFDNPTTHDKAMEYYLRALPLSEAVNDLDAIGTASVNLGEIYVEKGDFDSARLYLDKSLEALRQTDGNIPYTLIILGKSYEKQGDYTTAIRYQQQAFDLAQERDARLEMAQALNAKGDAYREQGNFDAAMVSYKKSMEVSQSIGSNKDLKHAYENLAGCYAQLNDFRNAYRYHNLFSSIKDTIYNTEKDKRIEGLQFQFELEKKESAIELLNQENALKDLKIDRANTLRNFLIAAAFFLLVTIGGITYQYLYAKRTNKIITVERNRAEKLLLNILPSETADELKKHGSVQARKYDFATVLFTDFQSFSEHAESTPPEELVKSIDYYFRNFDRIFQKHNLEKIKTIGDSYLCAGGLPIINNTNPVDAIRAGMEILAFIESLRTSRPEGIQLFNIRIGISTGPVVAGVVGTTKFQYDIWGDTVNVASRLENACEINRINVSEFTYQSVKDQFEFESRGEIEVKNQRKIKMYYVLGPKKTA
ncbi:MAG: tetratricopeptide repeat protein [Bacteroidetes bacterium]|nr:MAG: tetratricopeptide repeat protein [Bacteroidota bacterium]